jgi:hypothetical protein
MPSRSFYELLEEVDKAKTKKEKIDLLHKNSNPTLKIVLGYTFDPNVKWLLPETDPPYKPLSENLEIEGRLVYETKKLYLFVDGPTDAQKNLTQIKREQLFITILESIDPKDAKLLLSMKNKKLPFKTITKKLIAEAFPTLAKDW